MALAVAFDTLKFAHHLRKGGISEEHANAITEAIKEASIDSDLATKTDVRESEQRLRGEIHELEQRLTIKLGAMLTVAVGAIAALVRFL